MRTAAKTKIVAVIGLLLVGCTQPVPEPTPDLAATVRNAVAQAIPAQPAQVDVEATARAVVLESAPQPAGQPVTEAIVRAVVEESLAANDNLPNVEATARSVVAEELSIAFQTQPTLDVDGSELRVTIQSLVAVRRYEDSDVPISISEIVIQTTKFKNHGDLPSEFRLDHSDFLGMWFNNDGLGQWIEERVGTTAANGRCCYYLHVDEPALYRAAILNLPELTQLINDAESLDIDSRYLAEALERFQDGYTIVYESFTW